MEQEHSLTLHPKYAAKLWTLPHELLILILKYLEIQELRSLQAIPQLNKMFLQSRNQTIIPLYRQIMNLNLDQNTSMTIAKIEQIWTNRKIISLPFWGYKTDGGVLHHSIPFWIGKAFLKSEQPIVGLSSLNTGCFSGCLSQDYYEFSNIVVNLSKLLREVYQNDQFHEEIDQIDLRHVIMHSFHTDLDGATIQQVFKFQQLRTKLYNYARKVGHFLGEQVGLVMENTDVIKLPLIANLHTVEISRSLKPQMSSILKNCIQTLVIGTKNEIPFKVLEKLDIPQIAQTNLSKQQIKGFTFGYKPPVLPHSEAKFIMFKPNEHGILLWLDFCSTNTFEKIIPFGARVWTSEVHVCMIRSVKDRQPYGLCMSFIEFKGIMI